MIKHVIFDFDGTLVDSVELLVQIGNGLAEKYKLKKMSREEFMELNTLPIKERLKKLQIPIYLLPRLTLDILSRYKAQAGTLRISEEIKELLKALKSKKVNLSIISSNSAGNIKKCLKSNEIDIIDKIYSSKGDMDKSTTISKFLKDFSIKREEAIYIGDELRDIKACRNACIRVIAVTWGYDAIKLLEEGQPDYLVSTPLDIMEILELEP